MEKQGYRLRVGSGRRAGPDVILRHNSSPPRHDCSGALPAAAREITPMSSPLPHPHRRARRRELLANWLALLTLLALGIV
jgi:hypothetical protein